MSQFECVCGKRLKVADSLAGRLVKCPACGAKVRAPAAEVTSVAEGKDALLAALRSRKAPSPPPEPAAPAAPKVAEPAAAAPPPPPPPVAKVPAAPAVPAGGAKPATDALADLAQAMRAPKDIKRSGRARAAATFRPGAGAPVRKGVKGMKASGNDPNQPAFAVPKKSKAPLIIAIAVAGVFVIGAIVVAAVMHRSPPPPPPAPVAAPVDDHPPGDLFPTVKPQS